MITVEPLIKQEQNKGNVVNEDNHELLKTGQARVKNKKYWPLILVGLAAIIAGIWLWREGKDDNASISG
jgi:hypothetical protein